MKKLISLILAMCMIASMSITAFATEGEGEPAPIAEPIPIEPRDENAATVANPLQNAIDAVIDADGGTAEVKENAGETIEIGSGMIEKADATADTKIVIDLNETNAIIDSPAVGSKGTETQGLHIETGKITITGGGAQDEKADATITFDGISQGTESEVGNPDIKMGIQNYTNLTLDGVTIDGSDLSNINSNGEFKENYVNYVVSNNSGSLTVTNGASIIADQGDVAFDVCVYAPWYPDAPSVTIEESAGTIDGIIEFDGTSVAENTTLNSEPELNIEGGTFINFLLKLGTNVQSFWDNITISGGIFNNPNGGKEKSVIDDKGEYHDFNQFVDDTKYAVVVHDDGSWEVMPLEDVPPEEDDVVVIIPTPAPDPEPVYTPAPAPKPAATVVATAPVAVEVNGTSVELVVEAQEIKAEVVAPVAVGEAAQLKVNLAPAALEVEGVETKAVVEALVAAVSVEVKGGEAVAADCYQITFNENGELNIELSAEYMEALGPGEHIIVLKIGGIEVEFTVVIK